MRRLLLAAAGALSVCAAPPNILMVIVDDLGHDDSGFTALEPQIKTPTLDAFAAKSTLLGSYYVQPSCSPTRTTILSGRMPLNVGSGEATRNSSGK
ncbi:Arylsulfatase [Diplonema papillatum]|nr:Arylsulfatase [Diplonema papillatum]